MATSSRYQSALAHQQKLFEQLIAKIYGSEATVSQKRKTLALCQHRLKLGRFPDTNPTNVEAQLRDVCTRLQVDSRIRDAQRLTALKEQLVAIPIQSDVIDVHYAILSFLISLAGNLSSSTAPFTEEIEMDVDDKEERSETMSSLSDSWTAEKCSSPSDLSEWTDTQSFDGELDDADNDVTAVVDCPNWKAYFHPPSLVQKPVPVMERQSDGTLLHCLTQIQLPEIPLEACSLFLRSETELVVNCLRVLQGRESTVFLWNRHKKMFEIDSQIQSLHFSAAAMRHCLNWFSRYGSCARRVIEWVSIVMDLSGQQELAGIYTRPTGHASPISPTLSATAQALQTELHAILQPVVQLEQHIDAEETQKLTLIHLKSILVPIGRQIQLIAGLTRQIQQLDQEDWSLADKSKSIIDLLYDLANGDALMGSPYYQSLREIVWRVFVQSLAPLLSQLTSWLYLGDLSSVSDDFLISTKPAKSSEDSDFWLDSFTLKESACPKFLWPVVSFMHDGGKALQFMRSQEYGHQFEDFGINQSVKKGRLETLIHDPWTSDLLSDKFSKYLATITAPRPLKSDTGHDGSSIAEKMASAGAFTGDHLMSILLTQSSVPWTYISEEQIAPRSSSSLTGNVQSTAAMAREAINEIIEDVEMEDEEELPETFVRVRDAMKAFREQFESALIVTAKDSKSALSRVLANPTERRAYTQLRDAIFKSTSSVLDDISADQRSRRSAASSPVHATPIDVILKKGLVDVLQHRSLEIVRVFINCLLTDMGLMNEIMILKNIFLVGSPAMSEWIRRFSENLINGRRLSDLNEFQLIMDMQECFHSCHTNEALPVCGDNEFEELFFDLRSSEWQRLFPIEQLWQEQSPEEIDECALIYPLNWPLCLVVNEPRLKRYNTVFLFLMKIQWTNCAIRANFKRLKNQQNRIADELLYPYRHLTNWKNLYGIAREMNHFTQNVHQHVLEHVHSAFDLFCKGIVQTGSVSDLLSQHDIMLDTITRFSFQSRKKQWKTLQHRLLAVFRWILNFCSVWKSIEDTDSQDRKRIDMLLEALEGVTEQFKEAKSGAMMLLEIYSNSLGCNNELILLMCRLDYNEVYQNTLS